MTAAATGSHRGSRSRWRSRSPPAPFLLSTLALGAVLAFTAGPAAAAEEEEPHWSNLSIRVPTIWVTGRDEGGLGADVPFALGEDERFVTVELGDWLTAVPPLAGQQDQPETATEFTNPWDDRIRFDRDEAESWKFVRDIASARGVMPMGLTDAGKYWREKGQAEVDVINNGPVRLTAYGAFFDERRPDTNGFSSLDLGFVDDWRERSYRSFGFDIGTVGDRLKVTSGFAFSEDGTGTHNSLPIDPAATASEDDFEGGWAQSHRFDAKVIDNGPVELSVYGLFSDIDSDFRSSSVSAVPIRGGVGLTREFGGTADMDWLQFSGSQSVVTGSTSETERYAARVTAGPVRLSLSRRLVTGFNEDQPDEWTSRRHLLNGDVEFDLEQLGWSTSGEDGGIGRFLPSTVYVGLSLGEAEYADTPDAVPDKDQGIGFGFAWYTDNGETSLDFWRSDYMSAPDELGNGDSSDWSFDAIHTYYDDNWDLTLYATMNQFAFIELGQGSLESTLGGGAAFSIKPEDFPDTSFSVNAFTFDAEYVDYESLDRVAGVRAGMDFAKFLNGVDPEQKPYMRLDYYGLGGFFQDSEVGNSSKLDHAFTFSFGFQF